MFEGQNTGFATRIAPRGRPPTAGELWTQRYFRALDTCSPRAGRRCRDLMFEILRVLGQKEHLGDPNPHFRDPVRYRELWCEIGEQLSIGPPPDIDTHLP